MLYQLRVGECEPIAYFLNQKVQICIIKSDNAKGQSQWF